MSYCTFKYSIVYEDGEVVNGWVPSKGLAPIVAQLQAFVEAHFLKEKPVRSISIFDILKIREEAVWLHHVNRTIEFRYLQDKGAFDPM